MEYLLNDSSIYYLFMNKLCMVLQYGIILLLEKLEIYLLLILPYPSSSIHIHMRFACSCARLCQAVLLPFCACRMVPSQSHSLCTYSLYLWHSTWVGHGFRVGRFLVAIRVNELAADCIFIPSISCSEHGFAPHILQEVSQA